LSDFYRYIERGGSGRTQSVRKIIRKIIKNDKRDTETYKLVAEMIPLENGFEKSILPSSYEKCNDKGISKCKKTIIDHSVRYYKKEFSKLDGQLKDERVRYYINKLEVFITAVVEEAENSAYNEYIESLHDASIEVDSYTIGLISEKFNRDIYFVDSRTRMPYRDVSHENIRKRKSILVMWTGGSHYEIIGRLLPGNRIQREFEFKDSIIQRIHTYLYSPEKIPNNYPNLVSYIPKEVRKKFDIDVSDSEEDRRSDRSDRRSDRSDRRSDRSDRRSDRRDDDKYISSDDEFENSSVYEQSDSESDDEPKRESNKSINYQELDNHDSKEDDSPISKKNVEEQSDKDDSSSYIGVSS
jgi:hypothetical protein